MPPTCRAPQLHTHPQPESSIRSMMGVMMCCTIKLRPRGAGACWELHDTPRYNRLRAFLHSCGLGILHAEEVALQPARPALDKEGKGSE